MAADTAVDDAMNEVLGTSTETAVNRPFSEVAEPGQGPCTEAEAHELVDRAIAAAETFYDTIAEIVRRQAWVPLGHASPRELMKTALGGVSNPRTGKPYSRAHVHRMARVAWLVWAISERTGLEPGDLKIPERTLREFGGGIDGDIKFVDEVSDRINLALNDKDASPDDVQDILESALSEGAAEQARGEGRTTGEGGGFDGDFDSSFPDPGPGAVGAGSGGGESFDEDFDGTDLDERAAGSGQSASPARDAFEDGGEFGDENNVPTINDSEALARMRANDIYIQHLQDIKEVGQHLPAVEAASKELPEFLDPLDDDELEELVDLLKATRGFIQRVESTMSAIDAMIEESEVRLDY